jgi:hypothetical protein
MHNSTYIYRVNHHSAEFQWNGSTFVLLLTQLDTCVMLREEFVICQELSRNGYNSCLNQRLTVT